MVDVYALFINIFHLVVVAPLLVYVGYYQCESGKEVFYTLGALGLVVFLYHAFRLVQRFRG